MTSTQENITSLKVYYFTLKVGVLFPYTATPSLRVWRLGPTIIFFAPCALDAWGSHSALRGEVCVIF